MTHYVVAKRYEGLDFWNDPFLWDGIEDTHKQFCWDDKPEKLIAVEPPPQRRPAITAAQMAMEAQYQNAMCQSAYQSQFAQLQSLQNCDPYGNRFGNYSYRSDSLSSLLGIR